MEQFGWLAAKNLNIECLGETEDLGVCFQYRHLLNKFPEDGVFASDGRTVCFMDGYVVNKNAFAAGAGSDWQNVFISSIRENMETFLQKLRGGFCGYLYEETERRLTVFTDQVSNKAVYYYCTQDSWMVSNCVEFMVCVLRANGVAYHFNPVAAQYMLTYGYMLDDSTFVREIHRLLPGQYADIAGGEISTTRYHFIRHEEVSMTEEEAVEKIDAAFREAIRREFDKDREYGYRHLVDLSGGLDSRMVAWVAHDMGYTDQFNLTYCQAGYVDDKISKQIAVALGHEYMFKSLDDAKWLYDVEDIVSMNNGAALYSGISGGQRCLEALNGDRFGIEHTGMIGDVTLSTYYQDSNLNFSKPRFGLNMYSERLKYEYDTSVLNEYPSQEMFVIYTRGILGMGSTYMIRQNFVETSSPFMDVDFLDTVFSLPFAYRNRHHIYLRWMKEKYPGATRFGWEKWGGVRPLKSHIFFRKIRTTERLLWMAVCNIFNIANKDVMCPTEAWYQRDADIRRYFQTYYEHRICHKAFDEGLRNDMTELFTKGDVTEKTMVLTVLAAAEKFGA